MAPVPRVVKSEPAFHFGGGVTFGMTSGVAPELRPYLGLGLEVTRDHARLGLSGLVSKGTADTATGSADLSWWALRLAACPAQLASGGWFVEPCATFDAGKLSGSGYDTRNRRSASATWYGPGAQLRAGVVGFGVLAVTVEGGAVAPLARDRFYFAPDETAHQIPSLAGYVGAALGARL